MKVCIFDFSNYIFYHYLKGQSKSAIILPVEMCEKKEEELNFLNGLLVSTATDARTSANAEGRETIRVKDVRVAELLHENRPSINIEVL